MGSGLTRTVFGDPNLRPEQTTSLEFGLQTAFLETTGPILNVTYYKSNARDQIMSGPDPDA